MRALILCLVGGMSRPPPKRSKFKEERMKQKATSAQDQYELMDSESYCVLYEGVCCVRVCIV